MDSDIAVSFKGNGWALPPELGLVGIAHIHLMGKVRELTRGSDGAFSIASEYPITEPSCFVFKIPVQAFLFQEDLDVCVYWNLGEYIADDVLRDYLTGEIVSLAKRIGCGRQGFLLDVGVALVSEIIVEPSPGRGAPQSVLERLKAERRVEGGGLVVGVGSEICCICMEELQEGESLVDMPPCSHLFHEDCIVQWLQVQDSCPLCRRVPYEGMRY